MRFSAVALLSCLLTLAFTGPVLAQQAPHLAHEGRHGGAFATAASDTIHVEAVWSEQRRIRFFLVGATGDPLTLETLRDVEATAVVGGDESPAALIELDSHFEARIRTLPLPATISIRLKMSRGAPEDLLAFTFEDYSRQIDDIARPSPPEIPPTLAGILAALEEDRRALQTIFAEKVDANRLLPVEERIRERAIAIEPYLSNLPGQRRAEAQTAITSIVRSCWLIHIVLDFGNAAQFSDSVNQLNEALMRIPAAVSGLTP